MSAFPAEFFEKYPLYKKCVCEIPPLAEALSNQEWYPSIRLNCDGCKSIQTFRAAGVRDDAKQIAINEKDIPVGRQVVDLHDPGKTHYEPKPTPPRDCVTMVDYECAGCKSFFYRFAFRVASDQRSIHKVGQYPQVSTEQDDVITRKLRGEVLDLYKKGRRCEDHGYGIGAFAYYRRIVESVIAKLLGDIETAIPEGGEREAYHAALSKVKESQSAQSRIEVVKELLPSGLRPHGRNPLTVLYEALSTGLHEENDDTCLTWAQAIRETLVYLVQEVEVRREATDRYGKSMDEILEKLKKIGERKTDVR